MVVLRTFLVLWTALIAFLGTPSLAHPDMNPVSELCLRALLTAEYNDLQRRRGRIELVNGLETQNRNWLQRLWTAARFVDPLEYEVKYRGQLIKGIRARKENILQSVRAYSSQGRIPDNSEAVLQLWHGFGASKSSHAGSFVDPLRTIANQNDKLRKRISELLAANNARWVELAAEAIDLPESGHGVGTHHSPTALGDVRLPYVNPFTTLGSTVSRLEKYTRQLSNEAAGRPIVNLARSAGVGLAAEMNYRNPKLLSGMIFVGPLHPSAEIGFDHSIARHYHEFELQLFDPNWPAFHWVNELYRSMKWHEHLLTDDTPLLILVGEHDLQVSNSARNWFRELAKKRENVRYVEVPGAGHDVLLPTRARIVDGVQIPNYSPDLAYIAIHQFLLDYVIRN